MIYYGPISKIKYEDEILSMGKGLLVNGTEYENQDLRSCIFDILKHITKKIG